MKITFDMTPDEAKQLLSSDEGTDQDSKTELVTDPDTENQVASKIDKDKARDLVTDAASKVVVQVLTETFDDKVAGAESVTDSLKYIMAHQDSLDSADMVDNLIQAVTYAVHDIYGDDAEMNRRLAEWAKTSREADDD